MREEKEEEERARCEGDWKKKSAAPSPARTPALPAFSSSSLGGSSQLERAICSSVVRYIPTLVNRLVSDAQLDAGRDRSMRQIEGLDIEAADG